jgi:5-methylcytosine-specific restriction enzyme subunit McrC
VKIPIKNVYYLLCYAWNRLDEAELIDVDIEPQTELVDLFAKVLGTGVNHVLRRGLERGYITHEEQVHGIKGKLLIGPTIAVLPRRTGRTHCAFDDLSYDVLTNQIIKATIHSLLTIPDLDSANRALLAEPLARLSWVSDISLVANHFRRVQLHRNNAFYGFLIDVCEIIYENLLPSEQEGGTRFRDFTRDDPKMAMLFQQFLRNFLDREQRRYQIESLQLRWMATGSAEDVALLPVMQTDVVATGPRRSVVIDAKYYGEALQTGQYKTTVRSDHLYQIYAYLNHLSQRRSHETIDGMLVYPTVGQALALRYSIDGFGVQVRTLNLDQPWQLLHAATLDLLS